ncbi:MAG: helix-turn-helix transcriptional regulator [Pseudorhodobacter sp.]|nr:helix-turn-helix transcriptional regulator [Pseudorhodobacter sp.]
MIINPETLDLLMKTAGMTQKALADRSGVAAKTIGRILKNEGGSHTATSVSRIARALDTSAEALATPPDVAQRRAADERMKKAGYHRVSFYLDGRTALNFGLVEARYGISARVQIEAAPLFATLLAEMSLAERRKNLEAYKEAFAIANGLAPVHLQNAHISRGDFNDACEAEEASLAANDLSGSTINDDAWAGVTSTDDYGFEDCGDLFIAHLRHLVTNHEIKPISRISGSASALSYDAFDEDLAKITNCDYWAEFALAHRHVRIRDIPEDLRGDDRAAERAAWLAAKVPGDARKEHEAWLARIDLSDLGLDGAHEDASKGGQPDA